MLGGKLITSENAQALAEALKQILTLQLLICRSNNIGDEGAKALAEALKPIDSISKWLDKSAEL